MIETTNPRSETDRVTSFTRPAAASVLRERKLGAFRLIEAHHPPDTAVPGHAHEHAALSFVVAGAFAETIQSRPFECGPLSALLTPAGVRHNNQFGSEGARTFYVEFRDATHPLAPPARACEPRQFRGVPVARGLRLRDQLDTRGPTAADGLSAVDGELQLEELLAATWSRLDPRPAGSEPRPRWLTQVEEAIRAQSQKGVTLSKLAEQFDVHPVYLARTFREHYGSSVGQYLRRHRVDRAIETIAGQEGHPLGQIGISLGFYDQSHFNRVFGRNTGMTPGRWRSVSSRMS